MTFVATGSHTCRRVALVAALALATRTASAQATGDSTPPNALKQLSIEQLMDLEVTSVSKHPEKLLDAASAIQVVTDDDIDRSGASSIPEALRLADNLDVAQQNSHDWAISARGFNTDLANKLLVLVDGRSVYTPLFSGVVWDAQTVPLGDVDRIEVISGPGGTLWGANAVNGVINITTKSAKSTQGWYEDAAAGNELHEYGGVGYGGTLAPNVFFRVDGNYFDRGSDVYASGEHATDSWKQGRGGFRIDADEPGGNTLTVQGDDYNGTEDDATGGSDNTRGDNVLARWSHTASPSSHWSVQTYYDHTYLSEPVAALALAKAGVFNDGLDTYDVDVQDQLALGMRNAVVWGFGYRATNDHAGNAPSLTFSPADLKQNLYSSFAQDEITLQPTLFLTAGTKLEHNDYTGFEWEPNVRLRWDLPASQMVWAAVSRAVRMPSRIDHDLSEPAASTGLVVLEGDSSFVSETVIADELGYRAQLGSSADVSLSTFYNDYDDIRSTSPSSTPTIKGLPFPLIFENNLRAQTYGLELATDYQLCAWWRLHAGYDVLHEDVWIRPGAVDFNDGLNETADPHQQASLRSSMDLPDHFELDADPRWVDALRINSGPTPGTVPAYAELSARLGWRPAKATEIAIVGQNLLQPHHPEYGFPGATREEILRSVYAKVTYLW